ncbi:hypothetical protein Hanom_Chr06g00490971 [Helianthus anomalus]
MYSRKQSFLIIYNGRCTLRDLDTCLSLGPKLTCLLLLLAPVRLQSCNNPAELQYMEQVNFLVCVRLGRPM